MFKKILLVLVLIIAGFAGYVAMQPSDFRYERSLVIAAPTDAIFPLVNSQKSWEKWSPWAKLDPKMVVSYEGPEAGVGAIGRWEGNWEVGKGASTIAESVPNERIKFAMDFLEPMKARNEAEFTFTPAEGGTKVTWSMYGHAPFLGKAMGILFGCEKMMAKMFDQGLTKLAAVATADAAAKAAAAASEAAEAAKALDEKTEEAPAKE